MLEFAGIFQQQDTGAGVSLPTPYAFWPINEGSGSVVNDSIGTIDLAIDGATWATTGRNGTNCLSFDGTDDWCWVADPFYMDVFTICFWFYPTTTSSSKTIIAKRNNSEGQSNTSENEFQCSMTSSDTIAFLKWTPPTSSAIINLQTTSTFTVNAWNHYAVSSAGGTGYSRNFLNNAFSTTATQSQAMGNTTSVLQFGGRTANNDATYFAGRLQEVRLYDSVLTDEQMSAVYSLPPP